jgi:hypothetical protein
VPYDLELSPSAFKAFQQLVLIGAGACVSEHLQKLSESPLELGRPSRFPHRRAEGQLYSFRCEDDDGRTLYLKAFFHFLPDGERTIRIHAITSVA